MAKTATATKPKEKPMADNGERFTCHFKNWAEKETKGTYRFVQVDKDGNEAANAEIGQLYIRKHAFNGKAPDRLTIIVSKDGK